MRLAFLKYHQNYKTCKDKDKLNVNSSAKERQGRSHLLYLHTMLDAKQKIAS